MDLNNLENTSTTNLSSLPGKQELINQLRQHTADITFIKKDGTKRIMKCTLDEAVTIVYEKKTDRVREPNDNILPVWDLEAGAWRSVNIDTIENIQFYGAC